MPHQAKIKPNEKLKRLSDGRLDEEHFWNVLCADKMWRMSNLYWIKTAEGQKIKFKPNATQKVFIENMWFRNIILKARQRGFTTLIQLWILDECLFNDNTNAGIIAHTKEDAETFFSEKIKFAYDNLAPFVKEKIGEKKTDTKRLMKFNNGSLIVVSTSLRSGTYQYLHISEFGKLCAQNPMRADEVVTGALPTVPPTGHVFIESTAEGRIGHFYKFCEDSRKQLEQGSELSTIDWKFHFFPWWEEKRYRINVPLNISQNHENYFKDLQKRGISLDDQQKMWYVRTEKVMGDLMKREYPSYPEEAFESALQGAYFASQMKQVRAKGQICRVPIDPYVPIHTFWDLGRDTTSIWFFQEIGFEYRFVDYYHNSNESILHYIDVLRQKQTGDENYRYGVCFLPHDGSRKTLQTDKSIAEILHENRFEVDIVKRSVDKDASIVKARRILPLCYFDEVRCRDGISCLDAYRKGKDEKMGVWKPRPMHDAASHGADAFMTFSDGYALFDKEPSKEYVDLTNSYKQHNYSNQNSMTGY